MRSMTGYGKAEGNYRHSRVLVEVRSVNSKQLDLNLRMPSTLRDHEGEVRQLAADRIQRGKADVSIRMEGVAQGRLLNVNREAFNHYLQQISTLARENGLDTTTVLDSVLRMPEVLDTAREEADDDEWAFVRNMVAQALDEFDRFRINEGNAMGNDLKSRTQHIVDLLAEIEPFEAERTQTVRQRILDRVAEAGVSLDANRLEQELIFYIEKFDVTEEKVRLRAHCQHFVQTLAEDSAGRKLNFIAQEMGREINTLGSKSNHAAMQRIVVEMKDELEKVKEQVLNML